MQIILLDTRSFRAPLRHHPCGRSNRGTYVPDPDPSETLLGAAQWDWLAKVLREPAELRLVVSSIQVLADGHGWERRGNLPRERDRLFALIAETKANSVVFLSGDRHRATIYRDATKGDVPFVEITSSSMNMPFDDPDERGPHQLAAMYGKENFGVIDIDWETCRVALVLRGLDGAVVRTRDIALDALARD
ncbi:MAG: alkaline phosphatase D family protein [Pseudomonadota bacterium]